MFDKILFIDQSHPILVEQLQEAGFECHFHYKTSKQELEARLPNFVGVVLRSRIQIDQTFLNAGTNLKFIAREGVGVEHIDVEYAEAKGIHVLTSPEGSQDTVGEHTIGLLLCLLNHLGRADRQIRAGQWNRESNRAIELKGKTVGIIGYGNMGKSLAKKLSGFEATVIAYDKYKINYGDEFARAVDKATLFEESDIVSLHIFYEPDNHYFVNDAFLSSFKKDIFVINTARGLVLNTADLVKHLKTGKVKGAALDVIEYEEQSFELLKTTAPPAPFQYLLESDQVILSPHIAGWSFESKKGMGACWRKKL
ncbi:MAG: hydroxyacid dehydrogenase [Saprospiraceae bacterium]|nr:hydroxyacid dehydrogenase [Saprospiraceae bacterium]